MSMKCHGHKLNVKYLVFLPQTCLFSELALQEQRVCDEFVMIECEYQDVFFPTNVTMTYARNSSDTSTCANLTGTICGGDEILQEFEGLVCGRGNLCNAGILPPTDLPPVASECQQDFVKWMTINYYCIRGKLHLAHFSECMNQ